MKQQQWRLEKKPKGVTQRAGNQGGDGVQVSVIMRVTGVHPNEQPGDLEAGEGAHVTPVEGVHTCSYSVLSG